MSRRNRTAWRNDRARAADIQHATVVIEFNGRRWRRRRSKTASRLENRQAA